MAEKKPRISRLWGGVGIALLLILWEWGHRAYGALVLPGLAETAATLWRLIVDGVVAPALMETAGHASLGWAAGVTIGGTAGTLAGLREEVQRALQPVAVILLGIPAIAWVVMALLWFGGSWAVVFTVAVATGPLVFAAAVEGVQSLDGGLIRMAQVFRVPLAARLIQMHGPHMASHLFPALATTLAMSWKVSVMAELLAGAGGIGDGLAMARAHVDTAATIAWVLVIVAVMIGLDLALLQPLQRRLWVWRDDGRSGRS
ncbi:Hydroxymethylpyrimidine ABC transporter, transmembrane component [Rhodovulum sp. P5]|uniref:ABC transporter permease n=1 Tax=Rhodovulum sp. P5 TaxID=1564506 RepID=UPI0009C1ED8D|nr:ABC transporter permease subunit [Rhodovulum sp. P5]ARE41985.1 Hydroxymethylpyrimidine ABC transporter, transmembrane component [Rhodovulum sp. P5]